jgi:hypothetical protein
MQKYFLNSALMTMIFTLSTSAASAENYSAIYNTYNNYISVTSGFQVGNKNKVVSYQGNQTTFFSVTQIGRHSYARVHQIGHNNNAFINQISVSSDHVIGSDF